MYYVQKINISPAKTSMISYKTPNSMNLEQVWLETALIPVSPCFILFTGYLLSILRNISFSKCFHFLSGTKCTKLMFSDHSSSFLEKKTLFIQINA